MTFYVLDINQEIMDFSVNPEDQDIFVEFDYSTIEKDGEQHAKSN